MSEHLPSLTVKVPSQTSAGAATAKDAPVTGTTPATSLPTALFSANSATSTATMATSPSTSPAEDLLNKPGSVSPTTQQLADRIGTMRQLVKALSGSFEVLDKSLKYVAEAGPAIKASEQLEDSRSRLQKLKEGHEAELARLQNDLTLQLQSAIKGSLRDEALKVVKKRVREELVDSVNKQLHLQLPPELHAQTTAHPVDMLESRVNVHNAEARARNSSIDVASDPLHPLWLFEGKPHSLFPPTIRACADLSVKSIDTLLEKYEIMQPAEKPPSADGSKKPKEVTLTREEKINIFMAFIGVSLRVIPTPSSMSSSKDGKRLGSTLVISNYR
ncbi:hypothetical protein GYMLUDRAFT_73546 [Collybiopsis luxurians FD-317 M1]|uniref:Uncharacterized protein n=1 Tax=Collybiopsis luxurians FD-317 M1 TaxID=944289 RepID=A0A0D0BZ56_9AGAR|nr:hypothetical protein GYMLUDRAFT_73546 [Collybiopsis luxurians FD-317 M1]